MIKLAEVGTVYGWSESCEATVYRMTPAERVVWHGTGGVSMLAFELLGLFDDVTQERETEELETWKATSDEEEMIDESA